MKNQQNQETIVRKVLQHEIGQVIAIAIGAYTFIAMILLPIKSIEKDIDNITGNHLMHIQDSISDIQQCIREDDQEDKLLMVQIERTTTMLEQHIKQQE